MDRQFSLSTSWMKGRTDNLRDFFSTAQECGFQQFVLNAALSLKQIADISLPEGQIPAITIPCPAHPRHAEAQFASLDRYEKEAAP